MLGVRHPFLAPPGQTITVPGRLNSVPGTPRNVNVVRHRTTDFEVWGVVTDRSNIAMTFLTPAPSPTDDTTGSGSELVSPIDADLAKSRIPNLGPTRQQSRRYLKEKRRENLKRSHVVPIDGPAHLTAHRRSGTGDVTVFQDRAANEVLAEADTQYRSGYPTIAASSMLARRNRIAQIPEESDQPDMKFFAELVKPMQYRWKFQKDKVKTLAPSKHGYHPRSQSPTFHRLIEATEKLQTLSQNVDDIFDDKFDTSELETQSQVNVDDTEKTVLRYTRSEPYSTRSSNITSLPVPKGGTTEDSIITPDIKPLSLNRAEEEETFIEEEEEECGDSYQTPEESPTPPTRTHVKRQGHSRTIKKLESHTEIHLFLPHIQDQMSRDGTPDRDKRGGTNKLVLPVIKDSGSEVKSLDDERSRPRKDRYKTEGKRKKKKASRIKSGVVDKEVPDILNDVPTLISMSKEPPGDYHPASMCVFENCQYHMDVKKSTRLRQP